MNEEPILASAYHVKGMLVEKSISANLYWPVSSKGTMLVAKAPSLADPMTPMLPDKVSLLFMCAIPAKRMPLLLAALLRFNRLIDDD